MELKELTKVYGTGEDEYLAVDNVNLKVAEGEFVVLIGPSGCGKTTTLKMINYLVEPTSGDILLRGKSTKDMDRVELRRDIGYVIQSIGLFPHLTIASNVEIVPRLKKWPKDKRRKRTYELLELVGLEPDVYANRYPSELSGGEQQRIGVLRALAVEPDLILMDEPFGALDPITRDQLQEEMKSLQKRLNKTVVFVTHDMDEALKLADRIVIMQDGRVIQAASPKEILARPANQFVRDFIGEDRLSPQPDVTPVSEIMTPDPLVVDLYDRPSAVFAQMQSRKADLAVVVDQNGRVRGLVSANRIQTQKGRAERIEDLYDDRIDTIRARETIRDAAKSLAENTRVLCVVNREQKPIGLISRSTLLRGLVEIWEENTSD